MDSPMPSSDILLVAVACVVGVAVWLVRRSRRPLYVMLDWDLTCDCMSTPGDEDVETNGARSKFKIKTGMSNTEETVYMSKLRLFLTNLLRCQDDDKLRVFIVTRNSAANVKWMLEHVVQMTASDFVVLSDTESKHNKAAMLQQYLGHADKDMEGVVVLADDSGSEHKKAAAYASQHWVHAKLRHVRVHRPAKGAPYRCFFNGLIYGMMNQESALDAFWWATYKWNVA